MQVSNPCIKYCRRICRDKTSTTKCEGRTQVCMHICTRTKLYAPPHFMVGGITKPFLLAKLNRVEYKIRVLMRDWIKVLLLPEEGWFGLVMMLGNFQCQGFLQYFFDYKPEFAFQNNPKNLDPSYKMQYKWGLPDFFFSCLCFLISDTLSLGQGLIHTDKLSQRDVKPPNTQTNSHENIYCNLS